MPMTRIIYYNISTRFIPRGSAKPVVNFKESRMMFAGSTKLHRKSGCGAPRFGGLFQLLARELIL
jgi:hypothetical protein